MHLYQPLTKTKPSGGLIMTNIHNSEVSNVSHGIYFEIHKRLENTQMELLEASDALITLGALIDGDSLSIKHASGAACTIQIIAEKVSQLARSLEDIAPQRITPIEAA